MFTYLISIKIKNGNNLEFNIKTLYKYNICIYLEIYIKYAMYLTF